MYLGIMPNSTIQLFRGVPLNPSYNDTFYFVDRSAQESYFSNNTNSVKILRDNYRVEVAQSSVVIQEKYEVLYNVNYMRFINLSYESKWFYAFVTSVEYVNENATRITFQIDVMQTWLPDVDYVLRPCFVEREHASSDKIGDNIVEENLCLGEYVFSDYTVGFDLSALAVIVAVSEVDEGTVDGRIYDGIYGGNKLWVCDGNNERAINDFLKQYSDSPDNVTCIYTAPRTLFPELDLEENKDGFYPEYKASGHSVNCTFYPVAYSDSFEGYLPLNNKLYTYPFNYFHINDGCGNTLSLRYEMFNELKPSVVIHSTLLSPVTVSIMPTGYKGTRGASELAPPVSLHTEQIQTPPYPFCSWSVDTFKTWLAQNGVSLAIGGIKAVGSIASAAYMPMTAATRVGKNAAAYAKAARQSKVGHSIESGVGDVLDAVNGFYQASIAADVCRGNANNSSNAISNHYLALHTARVHLTKEYAKTIDDFFTLYGYAVKKLKKPNIRARRYYTYTKTLDCRVYDAKLPKADSDTIEAVFNSGIRFWKSDITIGDYSQPNAPMQNEV